MRKTLTILLLASVAASPALADKGGKGKHRGGKPHKIEREWRGGGDDDDRRGGWKRQRWSRDDDFRRPVRIVRVDRDWDDDDRRDRWQDRRKQQRAYLRELRKDRRDFIREARRDWREDRRFVPVQRVVRYVPDRRIYERQVFAPVRYAEPIVRYVQPRTRVVPAYANYDYGYDYAPAYAPVSYASGGNGLFGGGGGVLGALLPVVLQSALGGGDLGLGGLGGLGGLSGLGGVGSLGGVGGVGGLTGLAAPTVLPLDSLGYGADPAFGGYAGPLSSGYVPASYGGGDLSSLLLPALLGQGGSLF